MNLPFVKGKENKRDLKLFLNVLFKREPMIHRRVEVERESAGYGQVNNQGWTMPLRHSKA